MDIIKKSGAWFSYGETRLGQGRENSKDYLKEHPEMLKEISEKVKNYFEVSPNSILSMSSVDGEEENPDMPAGGDLAE